MEIPFALECERKVVPDMFLTIDDIRSMFANLEFLLQHGKQIRAKRMLERWMGVRTPKTLFVLLEKCELDDLYDVLEIWGKYARMFQEVPEKDEYVSEEEKNGIAHFCKGWLKEAENYYEADQIGYTLKNLSCHYVTDKEDYIRSIIKSNQLESIKYILHSNLRQTFSEYNQLTVCVFAIKNNRIDLCEDWLQAIIEKEFAFIPDQWLIRKYNEIERKKEHFKIIASIMYVLSHISLKNFLELKESALEKSSFKKDTSNMVVANNLLTAIGYIARIEKSILVKCVNVLNIDDFKALLDVILDETYYTGCFSIEAILFRKGILESIIKVNNMLPQAFRDVLERKVCEKAETYSEVALFESYWSYLCIHNKSDLVEKYFDEWMNFDGIIWNIDLSEREYVAGVLLKMAEEMKWKEKVQSALNLLNARSIGYVGRKEGSLFSPLKWFERIASEKAEVWKKEGCLLLNLSEYASRIGDNRAYVQIGGSVAAAAGKMGANSLLQFAHMVQKSEIDWRELTFDGIISALETNYFTEEELLEIWKKAVGYFALNKYAEPYDNMNTRRKIYCADIHEAIRLCAKRLNYYELDNKMSKIAQLEYEQKRLERSEHSCIIPNRWYESEYYAYMDDFLRDTEQMTLDEMFAFIEVKYEQNDFRWDYVKFFIQKAKNTEPQYILKYKPHIMKMLDKREVNNLDYDGCNRLYEIFFRYLDEDEITDVLKNVIHTYYHFQNEGWASIDYGLIMIWIILLLPYFLVLLWMIIYGHCMKF